MHVLQPVHEHIDTAFSQAISPLAPSWCKIPVKDTIGVGGDDLDPTLAVDNDPHLQGWKKVDSV